MWKHAWPENPTTLHQEENDSALHKNLYATELYPSDQIPPSLCDLLLSSGRAFETYELEVLTPIEWDSFFEWAAEWEEWIERNYMYF